MRLKTLVSLLDKTLSDDTLANILNGIARVSDNTDYPDDERILAQDLFDALSDECPNAVEIANAD